MLMLNDYKALPYTFRQVGSDQDEVWCGRTYANGETGYWLQPPAPNYLVQKYAPVG
jgi:hypothetical protein